MEAESIAPAALPGLGTKRQEEARKGRPTGLDGKEGPTNRSRCAGLCPRPLAADNQRERRTPFSHAFGRLFFTRPWPARVSVTSAFAGAIAPYNLFSAHRPTPSRKQVCRLVFFFLSLVVIIPLSVPPWHGLAGFSRVRHGGVTMCAKMSFFLRLFVQLRDPHSVQHQLLLPSDRYRNPRPARVTIGQRRPDRGTRLAPLHRRLTRRLQCCGGRRDILIEMVSSSLYRRGLFSSQCGRQSRDSRFFPCPS